MKYYITIVIFLCLLCGCATTSGQANTTPTTPTEQTVVYITKTLSQTNWLMTLSLLGCSFGVFSLVSGNSKGLNILAGSLTLMFGTLLVASAAAWIAITTKWLIIGLLVGVVVTIGLLIYSIVIKKKAIPELVMTVEAVKNGWTEGIKDIVNKIQSTTTKDLVDSTKG